MEREIEAGSFDSVNKALASFEESVRSFEISSKDKKSFDEVVLPLERAEEEFGVIWRGLTHLTYVKNSDKVRDVHEKLLPEVIKVSSMASQSPKILEALERVRGDDRDRIVEKRLQDMRMNGVGLPSDERDEFNANKTRLSELSTQFANNVMDETKAFKMRLDESQVEGISRSFLDSKRNGDHYEIGLDAPSYVEVMKSCTNREVREAMWRAYAARGGERNPEIISEILKIRKKQANLLGFDTHAELSVAKKMAGTIQNVNEMIEMLKKPASKAAERELKHLLSFSDLNTFMPWDLTFESERYKKEKFDIDEESVKKYFPKESVLRGLFELCDKLFNVKICENKSIPREEVSWHKDVSMFDVNDSTSGEYLASFFLDPYARVDNKRPGAWMDTVLSRQDEIYPVANLVCNFSKTSDNLMTFDEVRTLFHETGHALQHMLTRKTNSTVSGIEGVEWDAVELPSQFLENFLFDETTMRSLARHHKTGEMIPLEILAKLRHIHREYNAGIATMRQLNFAALDLDLHCGDVTRNPIDIQFQFAKEFSPIAPHPDDRFVCSFSHIFAGGYSAGYYSYKYAEILSADAFEAFEHAGLENDTKIREIGQRFRDTVLSLGGSEHPAEVFRKFRGRDPSPEALLRHCGIA